MITDDGMQRGIARLAAHPIEGDASAPLTKKMNFDSERSLYNVCCHTRRRLPLISFTIKNTKLTRPSCDSGNKFTAVLG